MTPCPDATSAQHGPAAGLELPTFPPCFGQARGEYLKRDTRFSGQVFQVVRAAPTTCFRCSLRRECFELRRLQAREGRR